MNIQLGKYRAVTRDAAKFGASFPIVEAGAAGTFVLTGLNSFGSPWGLFTTDCGFTFNTPLSSLEVDYSDSAHQWYMPKAEES